MNNAIYLRRRNKVRVERGSNELPQNYVAAILKNIESLGFTFSEKLIERLNTLSVDEIAEFYTELVAVLREMTGAHRKFKPMYPNFPAQVMEMSESRLYINAIIHYLTNRLPAYVKNERLPLLDDAKLKIIDLGSLADFESIFTNLCAAKTSLSEADKSDLTQFVKDYCDRIYELIPSEIGQKETAAYLGGLLIQNTARAEEFLLKNFKTATDVLRLATSLSGGDVSLAANTKFKTFNRQTRRVLLGLLENCASATEDMLRWKKRWIRLGEKLHPTEFAGKFPKTAAAFDVIRNDRPFETFNGAIEKKILEKNSAAVVELLKVRPGDFARRLDHVLRLDQTNAAKTLAAFQTIADAVSTPVLLQVFTHFRHRRETRELRVFFPKGDAAKVQAIKNELPPLETQIPSAAAEICERVLLARFAKLKPLGKCFLDERLRNYLVPFSQRSASKALRTLVRGSRIPLPESKVIRFFLWWKNGASCTDIDLSAVLYGGNYNYVDVLSYYNLKNFGGHHSGDIVDAPEGAAEFIDVDREKLLENNVRFVVMSLNSFTEQPYCDLPECFAGWMARVEADSGEIFEPRTVHDKIDVASNTRICIPAIIDLLEKQVVWADIALKKYPSWNNVQNNLSGVSLMLRALVDSSKMNLYDLFRLHIAARGEPTNSIEAAETIFSIEKGITPFDIDLIASEYL